VVDGRGLITTAFVVLVHLLNRPPMRPGEARLPWDDRDFSARMLAEHLDDRHDLASRRLSTIDSHVSWLRTLLPDGSHRVLDLGCGPGLYLERFAADGWACVGVDVSPAAIDYADSRAAEFGWPCEYVLADFRSVEIDGEFDLALCVFGELSTIPMGDVQAVFDRIAQLLQPSGRVVIELSTRAGVRGKGSRPSIWYPANGGLFAEGAHLVLTENAWFEQDDASVQRWWILEPDSTQPRMLGSTTWWHGGGIDAALARSGFTIEQRCGDLSGNPASDGDDFETLVLRRF